MGAWGQRARGARVRSQVDTRRRRRKRSGTVTEMTTLFPLPSPTLPEFTTLLLKGPYHASAPIHLCLTHLASRPGSRAVLLTPSRDNFVAALRDLNDDWLNECGGYGAVSEVLSRVDVLSVSFVVPATRTG
jgi:hypothetical protein